MSCAGAVRGERFDHGWLRRLAHCLRRLGLIGADADVFLLDEVAKRIRRSRGTVAVNALVIGQIFYLLNSRFKLDSSLSLAAHRGNRYLPLGIGAVVVLQLLLTYAPPLQVLFDTQAMPLWIWPWLVLGGFLFFLIVETEKLLLRTIRASRGVAATADSARF